MIIGSWGSLDCGLEEFRLLLEAAGGWYDNSEASAIVQWECTNDTPTVSRRATVLVVQWWLPDAIAKWRVPPYGACVPN